MPRPAAGERLNAARRRSCRRGRGGGGARARLAHPRDSLLLVLSTDYRLDQGVCACPLRAARLPHASPAGPPARLIGRPQTHARAAQARRRDRRRIAARGCAAVRGWPGNVRPCPPAFLREPRPRASARVTTDPRAGGAGVSGEAAAGALLVPARRHQSDGEKRVRGPRGVFVVTQWVLRVWAIVFRILWRRVAGLPFQPLRQR